MAKTINSFSGSTGDNALVDKMLGRSYDVVKAVYQELPQLTELQGNQNIQKLVDNFDKVENVVQYADSILNVDQNLSGILAAETHAQTAKAFSASAETAAHQATMVANAASDTLTEVKNVKTDIDNYKADIELVADNIKAVQTTSANIAQINNLSSILGSNLTVPKLNTIIGELNNIITVADSIQEVTLVANRFIGTGELDRIEAASQDIQANLKVYKKVLEDIRQEIANTALKVDDIEDAVREGILKITAEVTLGKNQLKCILKDCEDLLVQINDTKDSIEINLDEANEILLKIRNIYHSYEEALKIVSDQAILTIHTIADEESLRLRKEAEFQIKRISRFADTIVDDATADFSDRVDEVKLQKLEEFEQEADAIKVKVLAELRQKADEILLEIDNKLDQLNIDLTEINNKIDANTASITKLEEQLTKLDERVTELETNPPSTGANGDIRFGYIDYSLPANQDKMEVGTTYILAFDENHTYIQINQDTNAFAKDPTYLRLYIKSLSNSVSYIERKVNLDLSGYLLKTDLKEASINTKGIVELATQSEVEAGTSNTIAITPRSLNAGLSKILIKQFETNPNGLMNHTVQQIVKTIAADRHLQEELAESMKEELEAILDITGSGDSTVIENNLIIKGDAEFGGTVTVPDQKEDDPVDWPDTVVLNKKDILELIEKNRGNKIEVLPTYPDTTATLEAGVLYIAPCTGTSLEFIVQDAEPNTETNNNSIVAFDSTDSI